MRGYLRYWGTSAGETARLLAEMRGGVFGARWIEGPRIITSRCALSATWRRQDS